MDEILHEIEALAAQNDIEVIKCGLGHIQLRKGKTIVNYYPWSKQMTAWDATAKERHKYVAPEEAMRIVLRSVPAEKGKRSPKPAKAPVAPQERLQTNPAGIKNLYEGEKAPWDFATFIASDSDRKRIAAYRLRRRADDLEDRADQQEGPVKDLAATELQRAAREMQQRHRLL